MIEFVREAVGTARSQRASSVLTVLVVAGMIIALTLTAGRTVAAEREVLRSIDSVGTRSIVVRAEAGSGLTTAVLARLKPVQGITWAGAFSPVVDGRNPALPGATTVPVRHLYTADPALVGAPAVPAERTAYVSSTGREALRSPYATGSVVLATGEAIGVAPLAGSPAFLAEFEPLLLTPASPRDAEPVSVLVIIADSPGLVAPLTDLTRTLLALDDPTKAEVTTSRELTQLRSLVESQLSSLSRSLIVGLLGVAACLIATPRRRWS